MAQKKEGTLSYGVKRRQGWGAKEGRRNTEIISCDSAFIDRSRTGSPTIYIVPAIPNKLSNTAEE
jgi:hypothetical protein